MNTPICDFVRAYREASWVRLHMPGHKGRGEMGVEGLDITEIRGADVLYDAKGIIRQSEDNAASLFGAGRTVYSTEGSSLCIRAMLYLSLLYARRQGRRPLILAGRNAHRSFVHAAGLLDAEIRWVFGGTNQSLLSCPISAQALEQAFEKLAEKPAAVYVTCPDYLGNILDIGALSEVCRKHETPLLVDNAHGAYLKFIHGNLYPLEQGADMCCDSAHKTLPVLTGGAYLHIAKTAPAFFAEQAENAMALFTSTSPSYLILQSLDRCNEVLAGDYPKKLSRLCAGTDTIKRRLKKKGFELAGCEPAKVTLMPKSYGYTGNQVHDYLRQNGIECEFSDPDFLTMMLTPALTENEIGKAEEALLSLPRRDAVLCPPPEMSHPARVLSIREALMRPGREIPVEEAEGRILSDAQVSCPPCVPILTCGERIDRQAIKCFQYYGIKTCRIVEE